MINRKVLTIAIALVIFAIFAAPVSAAVTIETNKGTNTYTKNFEIAPDVYDECTYTSTIVGTFWYQNSILIRFDVDGNLAGSCDDGTVFECKEKHTNILGTKLQNVVNIGNGHCWFQYPDGTKGMRRFHSTWVDGDYKTEMDEWI